MLEAGEKNEVVRDLRGKVVQDKGAKDGACGEGPGEDLPIKVEDGQLRLGLEGGQGELKMGEGEGGVDEPLHPAGEGRGDFGRHSVDQAHGWVPELKELLEEPE